MKTLCEGCVFAISKNAVQIDCKLGRLSKYIENGKTFFNEGSGFYEINTFCKTVRSEIWAGKQTEDLITAIKKESANKFSAIIVSTELQIEKINLTIESLKNTTFKPLEIIVVITTVAPLHADKKFLVLNELINSGVSYQYIELFSEISAVDEGFNKSKGNYYLTLMAGDTIDTNLLERANAAVDDISQQYLWIDGQIPIISSFLHRILDGNKEESLKNKLDSIPHFKAKHFLNETDFNSNYQL